MKPTIEQGTAPVQFPSVFEALPCPVLVLKPDAPHFTILAINEAYKKACHLDERELVGSSFFDAFPNLTGSEGTELESRIEASLRIAADQRQAHIIPLFRYDVNRRSEEGHERFWNVNNNPAFDGDGNLLYIVHTLTDITEKVAHDELTIYPPMQVPEQEDIAVNHDINRDLSAVYLQAVIDTSQTGIFLFSPVRDERGDLVDFRFRIANRTLSAYVGQEPEAVVGALGSTWFPAFKTNGLFDSYADTYLTGKSNHFEFHYYGDGIDAWLDILATRINDDVLVTFSDHTSIKQLQQNMTASLAALKQSNDNLEQFAYIASHDLQEPLRKIKSFGDILATRYKDNLGPDGADMIRRMQGAADRMKILIEDLLTFSRISFQQDEFVPVDLNEVIREVLMDLEPSVKEKQASISVGIMQPLVGNALQMRQVFQNLLSNAVKFNKKDKAPEINITSSIVPGAEVTGFQLSPEQRKKQYQQIIVRDNGIGFEQQYAERIFQIFQRLHGRMDYPGTGVGLSIVQKVIETHKGLIKAESEVGKGATFTILLPA